MFGYITLDTNDSAASSRFYDSLFNEINVKPHNGELKITWLETSIDNNKNNRG